MTKEELLPLIKRLSDLNSEFIYLSTINIKTSQSEDYVDWFLDKVRLSSALLFEIEYNKYACISLFTKEEMEGYIEGKYDEFWLLESIPKKFELLSEKEKEVYLELVKLENVPYVLPYFGENEIVTESGLIKRNPNVLDEWKIKERL